MQGNTMYAEIPAAEAQRHDPVLQAGNNYVISRFRVCKAKDYYRSVPGPYMLAILGSALQTTPDPSLNTSTA